MNNETFFILQYPVTNFAYEKELNCTKPGGNEYHDFRANFRRWKMQTQPVKTDENILLELLECNAL